MRSALWVDLTWAVAYIALVIWLGTVFGLAGVGVAHVAAGLLQLVVAIALSNVSIGISFVCRLAGKLIVAATVFLPAIALLSWRGEPWLAFVARLLAFGAGAVVFHLLSRRLQIFDAAEREALGGMLKRLGPVARLYS